MSPKKRFNHETGRTDWVGITQDEADLLYSTLLKLDQTTPQTITATDTTITASDEIYYGDATDSFKIKKDTIQGILDLMPSPDLSAYFTLDQTTPQTIINGAPKFTKGLIVAKTINDTSLIEGFTGGAQTAIFQNNPYYDYSVIFSSVGDNPYPMYNSFLKSRSTDGITRKAVKTGDQLGLIEFVGDSGTYYVGGAEIKAEVIATPGTTTMPTDLVFGTNFNAGIIPERWRLTSIGDWVPKADNQKVYFGAGKDASITYTGTNLVINPKVVGTGYLSVTGKILAGDKILFTQTDGNEYIDSLADGYLDLGATTQIRLKAITTAQALKITGEKVVGDYAPLEVHQSDEGSWSAAFFNDAYSPTNAIFTYYGYDSGKFSMGTQENKDLAFYTNGDTSERLVIKNTGQILVKDKIMFTQTDGNEYIDSLADGYMDYGATTGNRWLIGGTEQISLIDGVFAPTTDSDVDLGTSSLYWKDAFIDSITMTGIISAGTSDLYVKHAVYSDSTTHSITSTTVPWAMDFDTVEHEHGITLGKSGTVTISNASPAVISWAGHGLYVDSPVVFTTDGALPSGLTAGTTYYVISAGFGANSFEVSATPQGAAINTSTDGSGTHTGTNTSIIIVDTAGCHGFIFSTLCASSSAGTTFDIWFRKNGANVDRSNTRTEVANANNIILSVADLALDLSAGDEVEMFWVADSTNGQLLAIDSQSNPTRPATPSTILTVKKISK